MSKKSPLPQTRRHIFIYDEDWQFLVSTFGPGSKSKIGPGKAIRALVHHQVGKIRKNADEVIDRQRRGESKSDAREES